MSFQDEMKQMFLHVAAGEVEPEEWGNGGTATGIS